LARYGTEQQAGLRRVSRGVQGSSTTMVAEIDNLPERKHAASSLRARAARVRRHARALTDDPAGRRLEELAEELDAKAREIETEPPKPE
jgi:hypothetical protein